MPKRSKDHSDFAYLFEALMEAETGRGHTRPNPPVGAVIVKNGKIIGRGYHHRAGMDHAEVEAIKSCTVSPKGATMYVTLEPCSTKGRVGACTDAIIEAGIKRVVCGCEDPNPKNRGKAKKILTKAGIDVCFDAENPKVFKDFIAPFAKLVRTGLPYVTVKIAMSLDGKICDNHGNAKWISSENMRNLTSGIRHKVDAIMVGAETIRKDDPTLLPHVGKNDDLIRVVISRSGKFPQTAKVLTDGENETLVFPDAELALRKLGAMGIIHVLCEGGLKLAVSLAEAGLVDEWITVLAPKVIGERPIDKAIKIGSCRCYEDYL